MTGFSYGSGGRQESGRDGYAAGTGPWSSEQGPQSGAPYNQQPLGYEGVFASNNPNAPSQASAPDAVAQKYGYAPGVTPGSSHPFSQPPAGDPPFGDPRQAMDYGGTRYPPGAAFQQPRRRVSPAIVVVAVIAVVGAVVGILWATGVFGENKPEVNPAPSVTTTDPSDGNTTDPTDGGTTGPADDDTTQSNDPQDSLGQIDYQMKPVTKQGDTYTLQDTTVRVLEYKADAREQVKIANSRDCKDGEAYIDVKIWLTNNGSQYTYLFDYRFYVGDPSSNNLMFEVEGNSQGTLTSSRYVEVGKPIEGWVCFSALDPPNAGKVKLYVCTPGDHYPKGVAYRREEPIG